MPKPSDSKAVERSCRFFRRLLVFYPKSHRNEYGDAILQLFRDQCRAAWSAGGLRGLVCFWFRASFDLLKSSLWEHLSNLNRNKSLLWFFRPRLRPFSVFVPVFGFVFLFVLVASIVAAFISPETFAAIARVSVEPAQTQPYDPDFNKVEFDIILSNATLDKVNHSMNLSAVWGRKYNRGTPLSDLDIEQMLRSRLELIPMRHTRIIAIRAFGDAPKESARLANEVAAAYRQVRHEQTTSAARVLIIDTAVPDPNPVRPNKPLNAVLGAMIGILSGVIVAATMAGIIFGIRERRISAEYLRSKP